MQYLAIYQAQYGIGKERKDPQFDWKKFKVGRTLAFHGFYSPHNGIVPEVKCIRSHRQFQDQNRDIVRREGEKIPPPLRSPEDPPPLTFVKPCRGHTPRWIIATTSRLQVSICW